MSMVLNQKLINYEKEFVGDKNIPLLRLHYLQETFEQSMRPRLKLDHPSTRLSPMSKWFQHNLREGHSDKLEKKS